MLNEHFQRKTTLSFFFVCLLSLFLKEMLFFQICRSLSTRKTSNAEKSAVYFALIPYPIKGNPILFTLPHSTFPLDLQEKSLRKRRERIVRSFLLPSLLLGAKAQNAPLRILYMGVGARSTPVMNLSKMASRLE